jgi:hypothetical protein
VEYLAGQRVSIEPKLILGRKKKAIHKVRRQVLKPTAQPPELAG